MVTLLAPTNHKMKGIPHTGGDGVHNLLSSLMSSAAPKSRSFQSLSIDTPLTNDTTCIHAASCKMGARVRAITASRHVATTSYDAVSSAPAIRWEASDGLDVRALYGAFMQQIDQFDQTAFHLPPAEADVMDPHLIHTSVLRWRRAMRHSMQQACIAAA